MNYSDVESYIFGRRRMGMRFGLERARKLLAEAGNPQEHFRTVHIVGTNGKGSTAAFLSSLLTGLGIRTGRMTSPHLLHYRERASVDGAWIPEDAVVRFVELFRDGIERHGATFFEISTVLAAWHFRNCGVELAVAEAGLGGRLDATRLLAGELTVFTGVEIEHRRILGPTEPLIAAEKLAIAKRGSTLAAYRQSPGVEAVVSSAVRKNRLVRVIPEPAASSPLPGVHQMQNAGLALCAARLLTGLDASVVEEAFSGMLQDFRWAGRTDLRAGDPPVLFDVAHNPGSMACLVEHLEKHYSLPVPAVVGFLEDKLWREMICQLEGVFDPVVTTTPLNERALSASNLAEEFLAAGFSSFAEDDIGRALARARASSTHLLVVTGSFFVVGEAMKKAWKEGWIEMPGKEEENGQLFGSRPDVDSRLGARL